MKFIFLFAYLIISFISFGQKDYTEIPELEDVFSDVKYYNYYWKNKILKNQILKYSDSLDIVNYKKKNPDKIIRTNYYKNGSFKLIAEVYQRKITDTTWQINPTTLEETITIKTGFCDVYDGDFAQYRYDEIDSKKYYWDNRLSINQTDTFKNGNVSVYYKDIDSIYKHRYDYYENGEVNKISKIHQLYRIDTSEQIKSNFEKEIIISKGFTDLYDSVLYYYKALPVYLGQFNNGLPIGDWLIFLDTELIEVSFNKKGELDEGNFVSHYFENHYNVVSMKATGTYKKKTINYYNRNIEMKKDIYIKTGKWIYYNKDGSVKEIIKY